jgi:hypothetical protein
MTQKSVTVSSAVQDQSNHFKTSTYDRVVHSVLGTSNQDRHDGVKDICDTILQQGTVDQKVERIEAVVSTEKLGDFDHAARYDFVTRGVCDIPSKSPSRDENKMGRSPVDNPASTPHDESDDDSSACSFVETVSWGNIATIYRHPKPADCGIRSFKPLNRVGHRSNGDFVAEDEHETADTAFSVANLSRIVSAMVEQRSQAKTIRLVLGLRRRRRRVFVLGRRILSRPRCK